jgi:SNF2 family DNA or RNA helicase
VIRAELYDRDRPLVIVERLPGANPGAWARIRGALDRGIVGGSADRMDVRPDTFLAELEAVRESRKLYNQQFDFGENLKAQFRRLAHDRVQREQVLAQPDAPDSGAIEAELKATGFKRQLKPFQLENLARLMRLPHGADFSVPGAGKTTVALANFALSKSRARAAQLLVVAPIAAFQAWKEDSVECLSEAPVIVVHTGAGTVVPDNTEILLTNYNRLASDYDSIRSYVGRGSTQIILDEAHRIKRGDLGVHGRAALDLAYAATRRDVLSGTPAPQGAFDLIAPMRFLYPGQDRQILPASAYREKDGRETDVLDATSKAVSRYFVRTPKSRLKLPPTTPDVVRLPMKRVQHSIYQALLGKYRGQFELAGDDRRRFDRLGRIMMYLLEAATNPMLLTAGSDKEDEDSFAHPPLHIDGDERLWSMLENYRVLETPWKYEKVHDIVAAAAAKGEKVIVWSTFVRNLKALATHLGEFHPAVVHGGVPPADGAPPGKLTRDEELDRFRHDRSCSVLLANPAACGEGVSLHHWCHHAVYLDRTFNAGHFLQSQDRIHRLGLDDGTVTRFTYLLSEESIDEAVDSRLREKVSALATLMDDPDLVRIALPEPDEHRDGSPIFDDDADAVIAHVQAT